MRGVVVWPVLLAALGAWGACADPAAPVMPDAAPDAAAPPTVLPARLSETGLYADMASKAIAADVRAFTPAQTLWTDGAAKARWVRLPPGATIDSTDMDRWRLPVGTTLWKEFARDGARLETRVIWRVGDTGDREADTLVGSYVWDDAEADAVLTPAGATDVRGTTHDVPSASACWTCHLGEPGHALGFTALGLGDVAGWPLSAPPPAGTVFAAPAPALGYLHANCGHCHNPQGGAWANASMVLRLAATDVDAASTALVTTTVDVPLQQWLGRGFTTRIVPGDPDASAVFHRLTQRAPSVQMPPLGTEIVDPAGVELVRAWISSLPTTR